MSSFTWFLGIVSYILSVTVAIQKNKGEKSYNAYIFHVKKVWWSGNLPSGRWTRNVKDLVRNIQCFFSRKVKPQLSFFSVLGRKFWFYFILLRIIFNFLCLYDNSFIFNKTFTLYLANFELFKLLLSFENMAFIMSCFYNCISTCQKQLPRGVL